MYIIVSRFQIKPKHRQDFIKAPLQDSRISRQHEPGTIRFELVQDESDPNRFFLSEAYKEKEAFDAHKKGRFFQDFFADISDYYSLKELVRGTLIDEGDVQYLFE